MLRKIFLPIVLTLLAIVFWFSPDFKDIAAGVAILLFGMIALENGFKALTEGPLEGLLAKATNKFYKSFTLGMTTTALLQSSSLISVITISFISTELVSLTQGVAIIFGANIGSTATAWLLALFGLKVKISSFAMPMLVFGLIFTFQKSRALKGIGNVLAGLGFLFLGIHFMKEGFDAYKEAINLADYAMGGFSGLVVFTAVGLVATIVLQSSAATMAVILTALAAGQITYYNSLALAIGANVGTTITAIIGAMASNTAGKRLAGAHLIFNVVTAIIALVFIGQISWVVNFIANSINIASTNYTIKLAIFHTLFNTIGVVVMYPFVGKMVRFLERRIKDDKYDVAEPKFLSEAALAYPQSALSALINETNHLFDNVFEIIAHGIGLHREEVLSKNSKIDGLKPVSAIDISETYYLKVKYIYGQIIEFAAETQGQYTDPAFIHTIYNIKEANRYFVDAVKDVKELQPNVHKYMHSDNKVMHKEYTKMRMKLSRIIRQVYKARTVKLPQNETGRDIHELVASHIEKRQLKLSKHFLQIRKDDVLFNGTIDSMIRDKSISAKMASSLLNDSALTAAITKHLLKATEMLYMNTDVLLTGIDPINNKLGSSK